MNKKAIIIVLDSVGIGDCRTPQITATRARTRSAILSTPATRICRT